jgi:hypothetical protein
MSAHGRLQAAPQGTKIFGIRLGIDPKILAGGLIALAVLIFWLNSRGGDAPPSTASGSRADVAPAPGVYVAGNRSKTIRRNRTVPNDRGTLRIRPVDATRGDIDPTLRLELLARLQSIGEAKPGRSLFEIGPDPVAAAAEKAAMVTVVQGPVIPVTPQPMAPVLPQTPQVNIPLKFYGFVRPAEKGQNNQGLFLEGDNIMVAAEGELIDHRYLVRELSAVDARLEDTQMKQGETLHVVPEARLQ